MRFILGSGSPRRKELLAQLGITPDAILPPDIDEDPRPRELPRPYCLRLAQEKALAVVAGPEDIVLTADTTVALGRRILGKPRDAGEAAEFLLALGGRRHQVLTSVVLRAPDGAEVTVLDGREDRLAFASSLRPVQHTIRLGEHDVERMKDNTAGEFYDAVFDCTGSPKAMERGFGGRYPHFRRITPQATRPPALPVGSVFRSSGCAWTTTARPMIPSVAE